MEHHARSLPTPLGQLTLIWDDVGLRRVVLPVSAVARPAPSLEHSESVQHPALRWLQAYFAGHNLPANFKLAPQGTTFQQKVWQALLQIPHGQTWSYARLAACIDAPSAVRAVGAAVGRNPLPIVVPCHRVIGSNGHLTGFSGGMDAKRLLLTVEGIALDPHQDRLAATPSTTI